MKKVKFLVIIFFLFQLFLQGEQKSFPLPQENIPENPPLQPSVILPDGRRFLLAYFDDVKVFWDKKEKKLKTNRPGWWIINYPFEEIEGLSEEEKSKIFSVKDLKEIKNWYIYTPGKPYITDFKPTGPAPIKLHKNSTIIVNNSSPNASDDNPGTKEKPSILPPFTP